VYQKAWSEMNCRFSPDYALSNSQPEELPAVTSILKIGVTGQELGARGRDFHPFIVRDQRMASVLKE
jgi:hypothetical protein